MSAETWGIIAIIGFSLSAIALATAVFMFFRLKIPAVIGDLSGKTVAREIKAIRDANVASGVKAHKSSRVNIDRGKLTEKVAENEQRDYVQAIAHASKRLDKSTSSKSSQLPLTYEPLNPKERKGKTTEQLSDNVAEVNIEEGNVRSRSGRKTDVPIPGKQTDILAPGKKTDILTPNKQTDILSPVSQTAVLSKGQATEVLREDIPSGTTVLSETNMVEDPTTREAVQFNVIRSIILIHSDEVIK